MTKEERKLAEDLAAYPTVELHYWKSLNGKIYWKCKADGRPLRAITGSLFTIMERRGFITGSNSLRTLNVTSLRANLFDWQLRKEKRDNRKPRKSKVEPENIF